MAAFWYCFAFQVVFVYSGFGTVNSRSDRVMPLDFELLLTEGSYHCSLIRRLEAELKNAS